MSDDKTDEIVGDLSQLLQFSMARKSRNYATPTNDR